jgi:hypothetical protein
VGPRPINAVRVVLATLVALCALATARGVEAEPLTLERHGVVLFALEPSAKRIDGIKTVPAEEALAIVRRAFDAIYDASPMFRARVAKLRDAGTVFVGYDAAIQPPLRATNVLAVYMPDGYDPAAGRFDFMVALTRTGIHWETDVQAALRAPELAGPAIQDMEGRLGAMRLLDFECEAYLVQEQARQDLKVDKTSKDSVLFRQQTDGYWCDDFRKWTLANAPDIAEEWNTLDPDIEALLGRYPRYLKSWN